MLPPEIIMTEDGSHSLYSSRFGVSYHSKYGAIQETQHVFINAALRVKAVIQKHISILDMGFGTGLNAYMTLLEAARQNLKIQYMAIEAYPITANQANQLNYSHLLQSDQKDTFYQLHHCPWEQQLAINDNFTFQKAKLHFQDIPFNNQFDIIYFDAFAPNAQPELWTVEVLAPCYQALREDGILVTYCAKGAVKRTLKQLGFEVESLKGPPGKREMTRAYKVRE